MDALGDLKRVGGRRGGVGGGALHGLYACRFGSLEWSFAFSRVSFSPLDAFPVYASFWGEKAEKSREEVLFFPLTVHDSSGCPSLFGNESFCLSLLLWAPS